MRILKQFFKRTTGKATESKELIYRSLLGLKCRFTFDVRRRDCSFLFTEKNIISELLKTKKV